MADLQKHMKLALDELRMVMLGLSVLLGFLVRSAFEPRFAQLPGVLQRVSLLALGALVFLFGPLYGPAATNQLVHRGNHAKSTLVYIRRVVEAVLAAAALITGAVVTVAFSAALDRVLWAPGIVAAALALGAWFGVGLVARGRGARRGEEEEGDMENEGRTQLDEKIEFVLTECRVVLPGAQAMLGFQFLSVLTEAFTKLPPSSKGAHLASLASMAVAIVLLMTPAAFHRLVEKGESTERFHRFAGRTLLTAMAFVGPSLAGDLFVIARLVTGSTTGAMVAAAALLVVYAGFWFVWPGLLRASRGRGAGARVESPA